MEFLTDGVMCVYMYLLVWRAVERERHGQL